MTSHIITISEIAQIDILHNNLLYTSLSRGVWGGEGVREGLE